MGQVISEEEASKMREAEAELGDELLFKQPESTHKGDCPICMIPLPIDPTKSNMWACCSKTICKGCFHVHEMGGMGMWRVPSSCPFCRKPGPTTAEEYEKLRMKRIEANDPVAMRFQGKEQNNKGNYSSGFKYLTKAAALGDVEAHFQLFQMYNTGRCVKKDLGKTLYHLQEAAIGGHPLARHNLGVYEWYNNNNAERAVKHWTISAALGYDESTKKLKKAFKEGHVSKEELAVALRAQKAAVDATKSAQRKVAEAFYR